MDRHGGGHARRTAPFISWRTLGACHQDGSWRMLEVRTVNLFKNPIVAGLVSNFRDVTELLWADKLRPVIDRVMPLSQGKEAYAAMERGEHFGKIVLEP